MFWIWKLPISDRLELRHTSKMRVEHIFMTLNPTIFEWKLMERNKQVSDPGERHQSQNSRVRSKVVTSP